MSASLREMNGFREAIAEAAAWRLMGLLFERPRPGWHEEVRALAREVDDPDLRSAAEEARDAREGAYLSLLGPGGAVSPREVAYSGSADPGAVLADLAAFHRAFAYAPRAEDPIDHAAVEIGFAGYLRLKEAYARVRGDREEAETAAGALSRFTESHLRTFAGPLARRLKGGGLSYLSRAARALVARAGDRPDALPMLPGEPEGSSLRCPGGETERL